MPVLARRGGPAAGIPAEDRDLAMASAMPARRQPMPRLAPHLAREMARGATGSVTLTLDAPLQRDEDASPPTSCRRCPTVRRSPSSSPMSRRAKCGR